jgi:methyl-accepting chemotaxis protein
MMKTIRAKLLISFMAVVSVFALAGITAIGQSNKVEDGVEMFVGKYWETADLLMETRIGFEEISNTVLSPPANLNFDTFIGGAQAILKNSQTEMQSSALESSDISTVNDQLGKIIQTLPRAVELYHVPGQKMEIADAAVEPLIDKILAAGDVELVNTVWEAVMSFNDVLITGDSAERERFKTLTGEIEGHSQFALFEREYKPFKEKALAVFTSAIELQEARRSFIDAGTALAGNLSELETDFEGKVVDPAAESVQSLLKSNSILLLSGIVLSIIVGLVIGFMMSGRISGAVVKTMKMVEEMEKGHLDMRLNMRGKDEIGQMARTMDKFADSLEEDCVKSMAKLADGNLTFEVTPKDENDKFRGALKKAGKDLNDILGQVMGSGEQVAYASTQVSDSSQSLSQGATEQASSLEEITSSLTEMAAQTRRNAENANQANQLSYQAKEAAEKGNNQMKDMVAAMAEINDSGQNISKIIKVIDEIAFQTNLLALNAAVEAARAGKHGKGFAVVAEEVRNLAARSAKAAKETAELIEGSVNKTGNGSEIANQTAGALEGIVESINEVTNLVDEIATSSNEQAQGISQVNEGLTQIDQVTQQNTANAEESAAAAEELSAQAQQLQALLSSFTLKNMPATRRRYVPDYEAQPLLNGKPSNKGNGSPADEDEGVPIDEISLDDKEFGKYGALPQYA